MNKTPKSLKRKISPPPVFKSSQRLESGDSTDNGNAPTAAAVEAGEAEVRDHLDFFSSEFEKALRPKSSRAPRISIDHFRDLYSRNQHSQGCHFVIHQHDHPVAGVHYDLRLQFSDSSSLSFSIPYGLPGNPNSKRPNRMAIETRVHNVWNNLIESASHGTGSLLIWDTGEYEVVPRRAPVREDETDDEDDASHDHEKHQDGWTHLSEPEKLALAFQDRHIHLRLHGARLPPGYTIAMRLPKQNNRHGQPKPPKRKRRHVAPKQIAEPETTESESSDQPSSREEASEKIALNDAAVASDDESKDAVEREEIRLSNAYPGATNSIGSIHQRNWFLSLDREASGFEKARHGPSRGRWMRKVQEDQSLGGFEPFIVMGRDVEKSVVTGRKAMDIMADAGVEQYMGRKMWRPIRE